MKRTLMAIIIAVFVLTLFPISAVLADDATEIELMGLEWDHDPLSVSVKVTGSLSGDYETMVEDVLGDWTGALGGTEQNGLFAFDTNSDRDADIRIVIHPGKYAGVLGLTKPFDKNGDGYFDSVLISMKLDSTVDDEDFRNVLRHEMGHVLGLGHTDELYDDLMDPYYNPEIGYDILPSALDIEALLHIYGDDGFGGDNILPGEIPESFTWP